MELKSYKKILFLVISSVILSNVYCTTIPHDFNKVTVINTENELENLKSSRNVAVVYYYKRELARIRHFFKEYDKSAEYLAVYGVKIGIVDCTETNKQQPEKCNEAQIQHNIYTYKSGEELLILDLETMFDVNSIMSNVLQLVLLQEVPIIQSLKDRDELIDKNRGKKDVIFTYQRAIGTYEHRIFMEVAFAYQDRYAFAVTTEKETVVNLKDAEDITDSTLAVFWVIHCKEKSEKSTDQCIDVKYKGKMDLPSLAKFLRSLSLPLYIELKTMNDGDVYIKEKLDVVYFVYDKETKREVKEIVQKYKYDLHGNAGIQLVDKSIMPVEMTDILTHVEIPGIGVMLSNQDEPVFMSKPWTEKNIFNFLSETLFKKKGEYHGVAADEEETEIVEANNDDDVRAPYNFPSSIEVETQDDKVAHSVHFTTLKIPMSLDHVTVLKDDTFKSTIKDSNLLLILFYLHFDAKSMAVLRLFGESAELLKDDNSRLASLSCYDWTDVCGKQNISRYPTIKLYQNGKYLDDYRNAFEVQAVVNTVKLLQLDSPLKLDTSEKVGDFVQGKFPENIKQITNTSVLGVFDKEHKAEQKAFKTVVNEYQKSLVFGLTDSEIAKSIVKVKGPAIIIIRHNDQYKKDDGLTSDFTVENIKSFIQNKKIPTLPELTPMTFPEFYQQGKPLVILFLEETVSIYTKETVALLSKSGKFSQFIFCWMDIHSNHGTGEKILLEYQNEVKVPALSIVNNRKGDVFNFVGEEFTETAITNWLNDVSNQNLQPSNVLKAGDWKPPGRSYDFLTIMDYENEHGGRSPNLTIDSQEEQDTENDKVEDMEARAELIGLSNSRLYKERKTDEPKVAHIHKKDEL